VKKQRDEVDMMQELEHTKILHDSQYFKTEVTELRVQLKRASDKIATLTAYKNTQESLQQKEAQKTDEELKINVEKAL